MNLKEQIQSSLLVLVLVVIFLTSFVTLPYDNMGNDLPDEGAETPEQLSDVLFTALKHNEFSQLNNYIPGEDEIKCLQASASEQNKPFFENLEESQVMARIQQGFENINREGIEKNINWSNVELVDYEVRACSIEMIGCNVTFTIQDQNYNYLIVTYDAVKIKDRWFLFQNLGLAQA